MSRIVIGPHPQGVTALLRGYILLALLEGMAALVKMLSFPRASIYRGFLGISPIRWAITVPILLLLLALAWILVVSWLRPNRFEKLADRLSKLAGQSQVYWTALPLTGILFLVCINPVLLRWTNTDLYLQAYLDRLTPYALWGSLLFAQTAIALRLLRHGADVHTFEGQRKLIVSAITTFIVLLLLSAGVIWTKIGLTPDPVAWGRIGVPILTTQVILAFAISGAGLLFGSLVLNYLRGIRRPQISGHARHFTDLLICLLLWVAAVWRWGAEPLRPSYFSPAPVPPNYEYYPYSDAANYDFAGQSLLIGYGLESTLLRPSYSFFLAIAQAINGIGYQNALKWQIPTLALIPPLLYLIVKALHQRLSGIFVGLLAILREGNSIALAGIISFSHAKLLMSDLPTALGIIALTAVVVFWLRAPVSRSAYLLLAGGILGLTTLMRAQVLILVPVIFIVLWAARRKPAQFFANALLFSAGLFAIIAPWLWRNWGVRGSASLSEATQISQIGLIGQRYSLDIENGLPERLPGETDDQYSSRMVGSALRFVQEHPGEFARFVAGHFIHNEITTLLSLPSSFLLVDFFGGVTKGALSPPSPKWGIQWMSCCSVRNYVNNSTLWSSWKGGELGSSTLPLFVSLLVFSVGLGTSLQRNRLAGSLVLATNVTYSLGNALVRNSGSRFNLPVDWVGIMFYGIGVVQLCLWLVMFFRNKLVSSECNPEFVLQNKMLERSRFPLEQAVLGGIIIFLIGLAIPAVEWAIPERFRGENVQTFLSNMEQKGLLKPVGIDRRTLGAFLAQDQAQAIIGRGLYPRYYAAGQGLDGSGWPSFERRDYDRLGFFMIGPQQQQVVLRTTAPPSYFPNASDVLVLGCSEEEYLDAFMIVFLESLDKILVRSPLDRWACPGLK